MYTSHYNPFAPLGLLLTGLLRCGSSQIKCSPSGATQIGEKIIT